MNLTYRGIQYSEQAQKLSTSAALVANKNIVYRGNSSKARINPKFPWIKYIKQLFSKPQSQSVIDPITFWYDHKRQFLEDVWLADESEKLDRCWNLTLQIEQTKAVRSKQKIKLKYRGVTYYR